MTGFRCPEMQNPPRPYADRPYTVPGAAPHWIYDCPLDA
jgi:hypothetical protein